MRDSLIPLDGGKTIELIKDVTVIGRKEFCDVRLEDPSVSKVHLLIAKSDGLLLFRDMCSTNGTKVNGQRVIRGMLLPNDKLQIAACKFQVQLLPSDSAQLRNQSDPSPQDDALVRVFKADELARPLSAEGLNQLLDAPVPQPDIHARNGDRLGDDAHSSSSTPTNDESAQPDERIHFAD